jgi:sterol desaturase/sphingolipid hydroxylase (fatty acid hydroxylase superfamily)
MTVLPLIFMNGIYFAGRVHFFLTEMFGICKIKMFMTSWGIVWYSLVFLIITDFSRFFLHYLLHHNKFLAPFHRLHHSAEVLTPITLYRSHPVEMLLSHVRYLIVYSSVTGVFLYLFNDFYDFPEILGASFFVFISNILGANLRHSNIPIGFGWMEKIFISPKMHQMHHSKDFALQSSNLGTLLSVWDRLFSTWKPSKNIEKIEYGIAGQTEQSFFKELYYPFEKWYYLLKSQFSKKRQQN